jgi:hypothetical protein
VHTSDEVRRGAAGLSGSLDWVVLRGDGRRFLSEPIFRSDLCRSEPIRVLPRDGLSLLGEPLVTSGLGEADLG